MRSFSRRVGRGFALPSAIFLLVILALLAAFMVSFSTTQQIASATDVMGSRAYWAARAGIEWGASQVKTAAPPFVACPATTTLSVEAFAVTVACSSRDYTEGSSARRIYAFESVANAGGVPGGIAYVERQINAFVEY